MEFDSFLEYWNKQQYYHQFTQKERNMGRHKKQIPIDELLEMRSRGSNIKEISSEMGISTATLSRRIAELENEQGILTKYRELQGLQLTALQFRVLEAATPEKLESASITELAKCFNIFSKAESSIHGTGRMKVSGLIKYLVELERAGLH